MGATHEGGNGVDALLVRTDADGETLWSRFYGGEGLEAGMGVQETTDGGFIGVGQSTSPELGVVDRNTYLWRTDSEGNRIWHQVYGGQQINTSSTVRETADRGFLVGGGRGGSYVFKVDKDGNFVWEETFLGSSVVSLLEMADRGFMVATGDGRSTSAMRRSC